MGNYAFAPVNSAVLSYVTGAKGQGVSISNSNALANGGGNGSGDLADDLSNQNLTVSFWMKRNANATNGYETASELFGSMYFRDRPSSTNISLRRETGVATGTNGANASFFSNSSYFDENLLGKWIHVAQVFFTEGGLRYFAVYINGELKNAGSVSSNPIYKYNSVVSLGGGTDAGGNFMLNKYANIDIDEAMYFNRALTFPEILSLRFFEPTSLSNLEFSNSSLSNIIIYPNPTNSIFNVEIPNEVVKQVAIFDLSGKKLLESNQQKIDVSLFSSVIYMVNIETESGKTGVSKLIKR